LLSFTNHNSPTHLIVGTHSTTNYILPSGVAATASCGGGTVDWVHKIDWNTGFPLWSGIYGSSWGNTISALSTLHPTLPMFCGMIAFSSAYFGTNCDLDFTATVNTGDSNPLPGDPTFYWSIFPFCQDVSSNVGVSPPAWTHTISSSGDDGILTFVAWMQNRWGGSDFFIQAVSRFYLANPQGLIWPASGSSSFTYFHRSLQTPKLNDRWRLCSTKSITGFSLEHLPLGSQSYRSDHLG